MEDDVERFAALLKQTEREAKEKAAKQRAERDADEAAAKREAEHAAELVAARRDLERAIDDVKYAQRSGKKKAESDAAWRAAKARVLELETGQRPSWAPRPVEVADEAVSETDETSDDAAEDSGDDETVSEATAE